MPSCGGPVYQPTTVSYEPRSSGGNGSGGGLGFLGPASSVGVDSPLRIFRKPKPQLALLLFALISLAAGIAMLASGATDYFEVPQEDLPIDHMPGVEVSEAHTEAVSACPLGILLGGVFMTCLGIVGMGLYLKVADWRRNCVCPCPCTFFDKKPQLTLLLFALIFLAAGIAMLASGAADWIRGQQEPLPIHHMLSAEVSESHTEAVSRCVNIPLGLLLGGVFLTCLGIVGMGLYMKVADWRRNCVCPCPCPFFDKKQSLARQLQCQNVDGGCGQGIMALNPSTDPLVSHTQYAPVSELPSLRADDEERRNLMPDNKDCLSSAEESDRMLEPDPRIVLRPVGRVEDA